MCIVPAIILSLSLHHIFFFCNLTNRTCNQQSEQAAHTKSSQNHCSQLLNQYQKESGLSRSLLLTSHPLQITTAMIDMAAQYNMETTLNV